MAPAWKPNVVVALHACDTATDDAVDRALSWNSEVIMLAPCCHHHIQQQLNSSTNPVWESTLTQPILRERMGDVLTDSLRVAYLQSCGYRTDAVQFVSAEHSVKNIMIRARRDTRVDTERATAAFNSLRDHWGVSPYLDREDR